MWNFFNNTYGNYGACKTCNKEMTYSNMSRHLKRYHPESFMEWQKHRNQHMKRNVCKNSIWFFFETINKNRAVCKLCGSDLMKLNLHRHLHIKHPTAFEEWQKKRIQNNEFVLSNEARTVKRRRGWIKQYMKRTDIDKFRCELCHKILKMHVGDYSSMRRHIRSMHPYIYEEEKIKIIDEKNKKGTVSEENSANDIEYVVEYINSNDPLSDDDTILSAIKLHENELDDSEINLSSRQSKTNVEEIEESIHTDNSDGAEYLQTNDTILDSNLLNEDEIKRLCTKDVMKKRSRNKSCCWNFFDVVEENYLYRCLFCGKQVRIFQKNVSNIKRHLEKNHIWQYNLILKYAPDYDPSKTKKCHTGTTCDENIDLEDRDRFKCKICDEMIVCGDDKKILFDHFIEEHPENISKGNSEDKLNPDSDYKVIIDADEYTYTIEI